MPDPTSPGPEAAVSLRPISADTLHAVMSLKVTPSQEPFVASNAISLAQALFTPQAWFRAVYADETPVGFLMLYDDPVKPEYFLWRLMIDERYQHLGYGRQAVRLLVDYVQSRPGATELLVSHGEGDGNPGPFYQSLGFEYTGDVLERELVMKLPLPSPVPATTPPPQGLTHIVLFKLKERNPEAIAATVEVLRGLDGKIAVLRGIEVGSDVVHSARSYDIALITRFDSLADMEAYQVHPIHQGVLKHMREVVEASVAVDYTMNLTRRRP